MEIIWHGQSCFEITEDGYTVVIDPFQPGSCGTAFPDIDLEADEVLVSHDHRDHNYREGAQRRGSREDQGLRAAAQYGRHKARAEEAGSQARSEA